MSNEIQELHHQINVLDRKRKALRAEAMVLAVRGKKKLADAKRLNAKKIDSEILTYKRRIDRLRSMRKPLIKLPKVKLKPLPRPGKRAKPAGKPGPGPLDMAKAMAKVAARADGGGSFLPATFQPSEASGGGAASSSFPQSMPNFPPNLPGGPEFQPSSASYPDAAAGSDAAAAAAATDSGGPSPVLLVLGLVTLAGGGYYFWKRSKAGKKGTALLGAGTAGTGLVAPKPAPKPPVTGVPRGVTVVPSRPRPTFRVGGK